MQAIGEGVDGIEFDVFRTKDGVIVITDSDGSPTPVSSSDPSSLRISDLSFEEVSRMSRAAGHEISALRTVLTEIFNHLSSAQKNDFILNVEIKGPGTAIQTHDIIEDYIKAGVVDRSNVRYSSFKHHELLTIRQKDSNAVIQPTYVTSHYYGENRMKMPGFFVHPSAPLDHESIKKIAAFIRNNRCNAIDTPTSDVRSWLVDFIGELGVGFCSHPTGPRRVDDGPYEGLKLLHAFAAAGGSVLFKVDDIPEALDMIEDVRHGRISSRDRIERVMGKRLLDLPCDP